MDPLQQILISFGINLASSTVYDFFKNKFSSTKNVDLESFKLELANLLKTEISNKVVNEVINYLNKSGDIELRGKTIIAGNINLNVSNAKKVTGVHILQPTEFKPCSLINVTTNNVKTVTGIKIGGNK